MLASMHDSFFTLIFLSLYLHYSAAIIIITKTINASYSTAIGILILIGVEKFQYLLGGKQDDRFYFVLK